MRAFVTGGTGFIGYHVAAALLADGCEVRALARAGSDTGRLRALGADVCAGDLATGEGVESGVRGCDAVFHAAAHYSLDRREKDVMRAVNVGGTRAVLAAARAAGVRRVVYTSSTATVGLCADGQPADESAFADPAAAQSEYKRTKILAERLALAACREGLDVVIVNPSTPVGWGDVKPTPTGRIVLDALRGRMPAYVDTGLNVAAVRDVAAGHLLAHAAGRTGERYILGGENMTLADLLGRIARIAGRRPPKFRLPFWFAQGVAVVDEYIAAPLTRTRPRVPLEGVRLARRPMYFTSGKAVRELGLPQTSVDAALAEAVDWFRGSGPARAT